jgi:hypothetical protein
VTLARATTSGPSRDGCSLSIPVRAQSRKGFSVINSGVRLIRGFAKNPCDGAAGQVAAIHAFNVIGDLDAGAARGRLKGSSSPCRNSLLPGYARARPPVSRRACGHSSLLLQQSPSRQPVHASRFAANGSASVMIEFSINSTMTELQSV